MLRWKEPDFRFNCPTWPSPLPLPLALGSWHNFKGPTNGFPSPTIIGTTSSSPLPQFLCLKCFYARCLPSSLAPAIPFLWSPALSGLTFFGFAMSLESQLVSGTENPKVSGSRHLLLDPPLLTELTIQFNSGHIPKLT